jgi:HSP20 family protein
MAIMRFNPFREMETMQRQMNRLFDEMMSYGTPSESSISPSDTISFVPAAEIQDTSDAIKLRMELPGIEPSDLDVQVSAEAVSVRGERKSEIKQDDRGIHRSEFRYGSFQRVIPLPSRVQNNQVQAEFKNGVLCLTLPKAEEEKNRVVKVNLMNGQSNGQSSQFELPQNQQSQAPQAS